MPPRWSSGTHGPRCIPAHGNRGRGAQQRTRRVKDQIEGARFAISDIRFRQGDGAVGALLDPEHGERIGARLQQTGIDDRLQAPSRPDTLKGYGRVIAATTPLSATASRGGGALAGTAAEPVMCAGMKSPAGSTAPSSSGASTVTSISVAATG